MKNFFKKQPKKETYVALVMFLGVLLSLLAHVAIEWLYLDYAGNHGIVVEWNRTLGALCSLSGLLQTMLWISGVVGGYFLGQWWWQIVYVKNRHWWSRKK